MTVAIAQMESPTLPVTVAPSNQPLHFGTAPSRELFLPDTDPCRNDNPQLSRELTNDNLVRIMTSSLSALNRTETESKFWEAAYALMSKWSARSAFNEGNSCAREFVINPSKFFSWNIQNFQREFATSQTWAERGLVTPSKAQPQPNADRQLLQRRVAEYIDQVGMGSTREQEFVGIPEEIQAEISNFSDGIAGVRPDSTVVHKAIRIARIATERAPHPDITTDEDGELSFYMRLHNGYLIMAEMSISGSIDVGVYGVDNKMVQRIPRATEREFVEVLTS